MEKVREIYFKASPPLAVEAGKAEIHRAGGQAGRLEIQLTVDITTESKGILEAESLPPWETSVLFHLAFN